MRPLKNFFAYQRAQGRGQKLKLDDDKVRAIRKELKQGIAQCYIAAHFRVAESTISMVSTGQNWGHVKDKAGNG